MTTIFEYITFILFFILVNVPIAIILVIIFSSPFLFRILRMKRLAKKYNLSFDSKRTSKLLQPVVAVMNLCEGVVGGKNIKIYDNIDVDGFYVVPLNESAQITSRKTIIEIGGIKSQIRSFSFLGYARIGSINRLLIAIRENRDITGYLKDPGEKNIPITYILFIVVMVFTFFAIYLKYNRQF